MANIGYIQVNRYCNNQCHFCSNPSNGKNISLARGKEIIDDFVKRWYSGVIFTGGEPTLSPDLPAWISYARSVGMACRIISNGMMCANEAYVQKLAKAGLELVHFSVYSYNHQVHDFLTDTPGSWKKLMLSITHALKHGIRVQINTVINHYNQEHLDATVKFLIKTFPQIRHFVWNNLDPIMMRKTTTALSTLPNFQTFEWPLRRALAFLESHGRTFRVERVPLCYMRGFEYASTETRKIVKSEERMVYFLDHREVVHQKRESFFHDKGDACADCDLNNICAGVWMGKETKMGQEIFPDYYGFVEYKTQKLTRDAKQQILERIYSEPE